MYILYAFIASFLYGLVVVTQKFTSKRLISNPLVLNFYMYILAAPAIIPIFFTQTITFSPGLIWTLLTSLTAIAADLLYIFALYKEDVTVISPMYNLRGVFAVLLAFIFLHETLTPIQYVWIGIIITAGFLVSYSDQTKLKAFLRPSIALIVFYMLFLSIMGILTNLSVNTVGYWNHNFWYQTFNFILIFTILPFCYKDIKVKPVQLGTVLLITTIATAGTLFASRAQASNVGISSIIISLPMSMVMAFIISQFRPGLLEKNSMKVYLIRFTAAAIMFIGAYQLK